MHRSLPVLLVLAAPAPGADEAPPPLAYPETATVDHVDDYHGTAVPDPYRWLEETCGSRTASPTGSNGRTR